MRKYPKSQTVNLVKKGAGVLLILEIGAFGAFYHVYHRMNTERDFRYYMKNNYSFGLESYYQVGEFFDKNNRTRQLDEAIWAQQFGHQARTSEKKEQ